MFTCSDESRTVAEKNPRRRRHVKITDERGDHGYGRLGCAWQPTLASQENHPSIHSSSNSSKETTLEYHLKMFSGRDLFGI